MWDEITYYSWTSSLATEVMKLWCTPNVCIPSNTGYRGQINRLCWCQWCQNQKLNFTSLNIDSGDDLLPNSTKPSPEPMLISYNWDYVTFIWGLVKALFAFSINAILSNSDLNYTGTQTGYTVVEHRLPTPPRGQTANHALTCGYTVDFCDKI